MRRFLRTEVREPEETIVSAATVQAVRTKARWTALGAVLVVVYVFSAVVTEFHPVVVIRDIGVFFELLQEMIPSGRERWLFLLTDYLPRLRVPFVQTLQMALLGTVSGALFAIPFIALAARNITPNRIVYTTMRALMNLLRTIPDLLYAAIFVAALGIGPLPGVLALMTFSLSVLAKLTTESVEAVDRGPVEALTAAGATHLQVVRYAIVPQVLPLFWSYCLYVFEVNIRASTVLGLVGAGGIGQQLQLVLGLFQYENAFIIIVVTFGVVAGLDYVGGRVRARFV